MYNTHFHSNQRYSYLSMAFAILFGVHNNDDHLIDIRLGLILSRPLFMKKGLTTVKIKELSFSALK